MPFYSLVIYISFSRRMLKNPILPSRKNLLKINSSTKKKIQRTGSITTIKDNILQKKENLVQKTSLQTLQMLRLKEETQVQTKQVIKPPSIKPLVHTSNFAESYGRSTSLSLHEKQAKPTLTKLPNRQEYPRTSSFSTFPKKKETKNTEEIVCGILQKLSLYFFISSKGGTISIKKQKFEELLTQLINYLGQPEHLGDREGKTYGFLEPLFHQLHQKIIYEIKQEKRKHLSRASNLSCFIYYPQDFKHELQESSNCILELKRQIEKSQQSIKELKRLQQIHYEETLQRQQELMEISNLVDSVKTTLKNEEKKWENLRQTIMEGEKIAKQMDNQVQKLTNFIHNQDERPILVQVSENYKKIEKQIFAYLLSIQNPEFIKILVTNPSQFSRVQDWLNSELRTINKFILEEQPSIEEKSKKMRDFVLQSAHRSRLHNEQLRKLNQEKTDCILKIIKMVRLWIQNAQIKEDYLLDLRKGFIINSNTINNHLKRLTELKEQSKVSEEHVSILKDLELNWRRIEQNYNYGNSFY